MDVDWRHRVRLKLQIQDGAYFHGYVRFAHDLASTEAEVVHGTRGVVVSGARYREFDAVAGLLPQFSLLAISVALSSEWLHVGKYFPNPDLVTRLFSEGYASRAAKSMKTLICAWCHDVAGEDLSQ